MHLANSFWFMLGCLAMIFGITSIDRASSSSPRRRRIPTVPATCLEFHLDSLNLLMVGPTPRPDPLPPEIVTEFSKICAKYTRWLNCASEHPDVRQVVGFLSGIA